MNFKLSTSEVSNDHRLLEVSEEVLMKIMNGETLVIEGKPGDEAVLNVNSSNEKFIMKVCDTSNTVLVGNLSAGTSEVVAMPFSNHIEALQHPKMEIVNAIERGEQGVVVSDPLLCKKFMTLVKENLFKAKQQQTSTQQQSNNNNSSSNNNNRRKRIQPTLILPENAILLAPHSSTLSSPPRQQQKIMPMEITPAQPQTSQETLLKQIKELGSIYASLILNKHTSSIASELSMLSQLLSIIEVEEQQQIQPNTSSSSSLLRFLKTLDGSTVFGCSAFKDLSHVVAIVDPGMITNLSNSNPRIEKLCSDLISSVKHSIPSPKKSASPSPREDCLLCNPITVEQIGQLSHNYNRSNGNEDSKTLINRDKILELFIDLLRTSENATSKVTAEQVARLIQVALPVNFPWLAKLLVAELQQRCLEDSIVSITAEGKLEWKTTTSNGCDSSHQFPNENAAKLRLLEARLTKGTHGVVGHSQPLSEIFERLTDNASYRIVFHVIIALSERIDQLSALPDGHICKHLLTERVMLLRLLSKMLGNLLFSSMIDGSLNESSNRCYSVIWSQFDPLSRIEASWKRGTLAVDLPWISEFLKCKRGAIIPEIHKSKLTSFLKAIYFSETLSLLPSKATRASILTIFEIESIFLTLGEDISQIDESNKVSLPKGGVEQFCVDGNFAQNCSTAMQDINRSLQQNGLKVKKMQKIEPRMISSNNNVNSKSISQQQQQQQLGEQESLKSKAREWFWLIHPKLQDISRIVIPSSAETAASRMIKEILPSFQTDCENKISIATPKERGSIASKIISQTIASSIPLIEKYCKEIIEQVFNLLSSQNSANGGNDITQAILISLQESKQLASIQIERVLRQNAKKLVQHSTSFCCCKTQIHLGQQAIACLSRVQHIYASKQNSIIGTTNIHKLPGVIRLILFVLSSNIHKDDVHFTTINNKEDVSKSIQIIESELSSSESAAATTTATAEVISRDLLCHCISVLLDCVYLHSIVDNEAICITLNALKSSQNLCPKCNDLVISFLSKLQH